MDVAFSRVNFKPQDFNRMSRNTKFLLTVTALLLIPILLGMAPLTFVHKMASGCPFSQGKQVVKCNSCPFHSIVSQGNPTLVNLDSTLLDQDLIPVFVMQIVNAAPIPSKITDSSLPLRC